MKYFILIGVLILLTSQTSAWTIVRYSEVSNVSVVELNNFLAWDNTDAIEYTDNFRCGDFSRQLARNATKYGITLGGAILSPGPSFWDDDNHIVNYVYVNGELVFIEPQTDICSGIRWTGYSYYKLYPNGQYVPSRW